MKTTKSLLLIAAATLALAGCGSKKDEGGLTSEDNLELNTAAEMLDASPDSLIASENGTLGNGEDDGANEEDAGNSADAASGNGA